MLMGVLWICIDQGVCIGDEIDLVGFDDLLVFSFINFVFIVVVQDIDVMGKVVVDLFNCVMFGEFISFVCLDIYFIVRVLI